MVSFRHILCPTDFSDTSSRALAYAAAFAARFESRLTVLHVTAGLDEPLEPAPAPEAALPPGPGSRDRIVARLRTSIGQAGAAAVDARPVAQEGRAPEAMVTCAAALSVDLIVMGTHGLGGFHRLLLGSVAEKVVRTATCPGRVTVLSALEYLDPEEPPERCVRRSARCSPSARDAADDPTAGRMGHAA